MPIAIPIQNQKSKIQTLNPHPYIPLFPRAHLTLLVGDPGVGKSLLAAHLAARVALRSPLPPRPFTPRPLAEDQPCDPEDRPGIALICSREEDSFTLDQRYAHAFRGTAVPPQLLRWSATTSLQPPSPSHVLLEDHRRPTSPLLQELHEYVRVRGMPIRLVILDPLSAFLGNLDASNSPSLIRAALTPLIDFAYHHDISVVGIMHPGRRQARDPLNRLCQSHVYAAMARSIVLLTYDDLTGQPNRRLLIPLKNAFTVADRAYAFSFHPGTAEDPLDLLPPYIEFESDPIKLPSLASLGPRHSTDFLEDSDLEQALDLLKITLAKGRKPSAQLFSEARSLGISSATLKRAKRLLKIHAARDRKRWYFSLPSSIGGVR